MNNSLSNVVVEMSKRFFTSRSRPSTPPPQTQQSMCKQTLHVEVCQASDSTVSKDNVMNFVNLEIKELQKIPLNVFLTQENFRYKFSDVHIRSIYFSTGDEKPYILPEMVKNCEYYLYRLNEEEAAIEAMQNEGEEISATTHWNLPALEFHGLWDNLFYNDNIKERLLNFVETAMIYSERQVNPHVISWNKVILLHGPPGTGKTSLCKALAQKITIRLSNRFTRGELIEINSHSLFSKWFSESGKLVMNLFSEIKTLLQDETTLVCILMDEVESLAHTRKTCSNGSEPSDSIRVVNALLTQIDNLKRHPNVLIMTTSNLTEAIDLAFVDRADIKQYIPLPTDLAIYKIYASCIKELMRTGFIEQQEILDASQFRLMKDEYKHRFDGSFKLFELAKESGGLSGRTLRKMPFLAHALFEDSKRCNLTKFIESMSHAVQHEQRIRSQELNIANNNMD